MDDARSGGDAVSAEVDSAVAAIGTPVCSAGTSCFLSSARRIDMADVPSTGNREYNVWVCFDNNVLSTN